MVYPLEDGHPSRYLPGPTCVNFVHATNTANQVVSKLWLAVDSSGGRCPVGHSRELPGWSSPHPQLDWLRRDRDQRRSAAVHSATHDGTCLHRHRRPQLVSSSGRRQRLPATSCRRQPVGVLAFKRSPFAFSALTLLVGRQVGHPACIRGAGVVICPERDADLHMAQLMPLLLIASYFPPGPQLPPQPLRWLLPVLLLGEQRHNGCEQFA